MSRTTVFKGLADVNIIGMTGAKARYLAYNLEDWLRSGSHKAEIADAVLDHIASGQAPRASQRLSHLISYAATHVPKYRDYSDAALSELPIARKADMQSDPQLWSSHDQRLKVVRTVQTSGSTGRPAEFRLDFGKNLRRTAETVAYNKSGGLLVGDRFLHLTPSPGGGTVSQVLQNEVRVVPSSLNSAGWDSVIPTTKDVNLRGVVGFPSLIASLATSMTGAGVVSPSVQTVIGLGEAFDDRYAERIRVAFPNATLISRYSATELGILGHQCASGSYHLNRLHYHFEFLSPESDTDVEPGTSARLIVTDLFARYMPLIRYEIGDVVTYRHQCACGFPGLVLESIEGRVIDMISSPTGVDIPGQRIDGAVKRVPGIHHYRFTQTDQSSYTLSVVPGPGFSKEGCHQELREILGSDAQIVVDVVDDIPPLKSGKHATVINEFNREQRQ